MKRTLVLLAALAIALPLFAAEGKEIASKVFVIHNRQPSDILSAVSLLGSGEGRAGMHVNNELKTLTVRDFPENIATIEDAIKRLDVAPAESPVAEMHLSVLIGSKTALSGSVPEDLEPVVKELRNALRYSHYALIISSVQRVTAGTQAEGSGLIEPSIIGTPKLPAEYHFRLRHPSILLGDRATISAEEFDFHLRVGLDINGKPEYTSIGFNTPVTVRDGETVVIGTTTVGDKALIVVLNAKIGGK